jgi:hypothetical protein
MHVTGYGIRTLVTPVALAMLAAAVPAAAQEVPRVGVVTALDGSVTVARAAAPEPLALRFKDGVFLNDRIKTGEQSIVRVLLGGKAVVTVRERSTLAITEVPGTSTLSLLSGGIAVAVVRERMKPGESLEIRMPNAVAAVRGTSLIADRQGDRSIITVLHGLVEIRRLDTAAARLGSAIVQVRGLQRVTITGPPAASLPTPEKITLDQARRVSSPFAVARRQAAAAAVLAPATVGQTLPDPGQLRPATVPAADAGERALEGTALGQRPTPPPTALPPSRARAKARHLPPMKLSLPKVYDATK